jgi:hypothetical protein
MPRYEQSGVPFYLGTIDENKTERIGQVKAAFVQLCDEAYPDLQMQMAGMQAIYRDVEASMRANIIAGLIRRSDLIAAVNACTTVEQVWEVNVTYDNLTPTFIPRTNYNHASGAPNVSLSNVETTIGSVTITPSHANAKIKLEARCDLTKDGGTTVRIATVAIRRDSDMIGQRCVVRSANVANSEYGPAFIVEVDSPGTTDEVTYTLRGITNAGNSTATRATLTATEL